MKRIELKYHTSRFVSELLFKELGDIFKIDKNAKTPIYYENVSIYYDDRFLSSYSEKHEGDNIRDKFRLRLSRPYKQDTFSRCQIEIKKSLYMDENNFVKNKNFEKFKLDIKNILNEFYFKLESRGNRKVAAE